MSKADDQRTAFERIEGLVRPRAIEESEMHKAFLLWLLETIYRMDEVPAQDAVCDGPSDMGIDGIIVDDEDREIIVFQAKWKKAFPSSLGSSDLQQFAGTRGYFADERSVNELIGLTRNEQLKGLLVKGDVAAKIADGYRVQQVFISNVPLDNDGQAYLQAAHLDPQSMEVYDLTRLAPVADQLEREWFVSEPVSLSLSATRYFVDGNPEDPRMVISSMKASELVLLPGISDTRLFAQNVRLSLGRTKVNQEIAKSVQSVDEHKDFITFHNGLTIVAKDIVVDNDKITLNNYSVCNGCQSLVIFYKLRHLLSQSLETVVRFVRVDDDRGRTASIAYRTNNQNAVSLRDLSANDNLQVMLKNEFDGYFGEYATYGIKRGAIPETSSIEELPNESAGQLLMALYLRDPANVHQKSRIFGDRYQSIFRRSINAPQIRLSQIMMTVVIDTLDGVTDERIRKYGLTRFLILYLVGEVMRQEVDGKRFLESPLPYLAVRKGIGADRQAAILTQVRQIAHEVVLELDYYLQQQGEGYDYKSRFKADSEIKSIRGEIVRAYQKDKTRDRATVFALPSS